MNEDSQIQELTTLKTIAEILNQSHEIPSMLNTVLEKLLNLTGLTTGWIFLMDEDKEYQFAADYGLPPALLHEGKFPMQSGSCWCMERYWDGRLRNAVNILNCKRIENSSAHSWGDTNGITHHATVPLHSGDIRFGLLNVAAPGKSHFSDKELALLQSVAFQIGGAIERIRLYEGEQRRADVFAKLGELSRSISLLAQEGLGAHSIAKQSIELIGAYFDWKTVALMEQNPGSYELLAVHTIINNDHIRQNIPLKSAKWLDQALSEHRLIVASSSEAGGLGINEPAQSFESAIAVPIQYTHFSSMILLVAGAKKNEFHRIDQELLESVAEHITIAMKNSLYEENRRDITRLDERNRMARDLHDSVCQMLFSLSMTAKGVDGLLSQQEFNAARASIQDVQALSQSALKTMRELILQLRPSELKNGLLTALKGYGEQLELQVEIVQTGFSSLLPHALEETLWRLGQEALNNISKHAATEECRINLYREKDQVTMTVVDSGRGFTYPIQAATGNSIGISGMQERVKTLGGQLTIESKPQEGTIVTISLPYKGFGEIMDGN